MAQVHGKEIERNLLLAMVLVAKDPESENRKATQLVMLEALRWELES